MIKDEEYKKVLDLGLVLDHYFLLCNLSRGIAPIESKRIQGFVNLLTKKGFIENDLVTQKGLDLIQNCTYAEPVITKKISQLVIDYGNWIADLHKKCQDKLIELTGKKQVMAKINNVGKGYSFLPNPTDLGRSISRFVDAYKNKDYELIEKTILAYIDRCSSKRDWFPILDNYIIKQGKSTMMTDMENIEEPVEEYKSTQKLM